ncbi:MAG: hypothetical protein KBT34_09790 [Prevotella sp.]|nr:hypothetical protein [Candidatus Prevotella equi]
MKYYYNGKLVRTSEKHIYTNAVIDKSNGKCMGCRKNYELCVAYIESEISRYNGYIKFVNEAIHAINEGKSGYYYRFSGQKKYHVFKEGDTLEHYEDLMNMYRSNLDHIINNYEVVELESK